jgi:glycosyltransferase involved in cell wall biosynthesis
LLVEPGDPDATARAIASVLDDVQLQQRMAGHGRSFVFRHFGIQRTVREIAAVLCPGLGGLADAAPVLRRTAHV